MTKKNCFVFYSGATDVTGQKLADELGIDGGKTIPEDKTLIIGWGSKTKEDIALSANIKTINHPNKIRANRNKFTTLRALTENIVAPFVSAAQVMAAIDNRRSPISLPLVGRSNFHQSGRNFHICLTKSHVKNAISENCDYFQNYLEIETEYRLHVFDGKVIYAQKKVKRDDVEEAYKTQHAEKITNIANKNDKKLDNETLKYTLERLAKEHSNVDMIVRSNRRGWKFSHIKNVDKNMKKQAIDAVKTVGLDFGAVDCCLDSDEKPWVIEINSGPGLEESTFKAYIDAFETKLKEIMTPPKPKKMMADYMPHNTTEKSTGIKQSKLTSTSAKTRLGGMRELLDLIEDADEAEAVAVENLIKKRFGTTR